MKVAITGASGFLGGTLAHAYRKLGGDVIAYVRSTSNVSSLEDWGAALVYGELSDQDGFHQLIEGADLAIHCAALTTDFGPWDQFQKINIDGTRNFLEACLAANCPRAIYISSVVVYGNGRHNRGTDEEAPYETLVTDNYTKSKIIADRLALDYYRDKNLPITIIRPGYIWGSGDRAIMPLLIKSIKKGILGVVDGGDNLMNLSHVDNVTGGIMLAAEKEEAIGRAYNLTDGSKVSTRRFLTDLLDILGVEFNLRSFPYVPAYVAGYFCELYARLRRYKIAPPLTRYAVRVGKYDQVFDISRAMYEFGYKPKISYVEGMASMAAYVRSLYYGQK